MCYFSRGCEVHVPMPLSLVTQVDVVFSMVGQKYPAHRTFLGRPLALRCCPHMPLWTSTKTSWVSLGPKHLISGLVKPLLYNIPSTKVNEQALRFSLVLEVDKIVTRKGGFEL